MAYKLEISHWMKHNVVSINQTASVKEAATTLVDKRIGTLPVLDALDHLVGVLTITDIVHLFEPGFVSLLENIDFVKDFGALKTPSKEDIERMEKLTVADIMEPPVFVEEDCSLLRAMSVIEKHELTDLLVVRGEHLIGIASRVDIGGAFLTDWLAQKPH